MKFIYPHTAPDKANAILNNRHVRVIPAPAKHNMPQVEADDLPLAIARLGAEPYAHPAPVATAKSLSKRELVDKLIDFGVAEQFSAMLATLPPAEKLRWEASPTISPEYPYIKDNRAVFCETLGITDSQLDDIFR